MDDFTRKRYERLCEQYLEELERAGTRAALDVAWHNLKSGEEIRKQFIPFLKEYARERGYYV